ncbi:MAG: recombinase family protein [Desulfobacteraceae bacterium]|jgi:DNA invertase Pin-like site-specific DNA recombinase
MMDSQRSGKIGADHLGRIAVVYLRQSSEWQVQHNKESQRLQYALVDRVKSLGWSRVEVIDSDLGSSAAVGAACREGFDRLIGMVAKEEVGIVMSREVSRLSRTDKDWCRLFEVCQLFGTLIGDAEHIYDLNTMDDQLILGIKGTMSVVELKVLKMRLLAGQEEKARRGELFRKVPVGYVKDGAEGVVKDPDQRTREAVELVFRKFRELWSVRQTFLWFQTECVELPVNKSMEGKNRIVWQLPTYSFVKNMLTNAFYSGAYVYGRRQTKREMVDGRIVSRMGRNLPPEECRVFIRDHHEEYIDWATFEENQRMISNNALKTEPDESISAVRSGQGLLGGLIRCGRCGRKLYVRYWGKNGTSARYLCKGDFDAGGKYCLAFGGATVDRRFSDEILKVVSPFGVRASLAALDRLKAKNDDRRSALERQIQQVEYEARRAFEQYNEVDPRNRLVAQELERRWNETLQNLEGLKSSLEDLEKEARPLERADRHKILKMGEDFGAIWGSRHCPVETKKKIIRTVVEEIIVNEDDAGDTLFFTIHWKGGSHTRFEMEKPRSGVGRKTSMEDIEIIRRMGVRYGDDEIARALNKLGRRTGKGKRWNEQRVRTVRYRYKIAGQKRGKQDPEVLTLGRAAAYCDVSQSSIKRLVSAGLLEKKQVAPWAPWEIKRSDLDADPVHGILKRLRETGKLVLKGDSGQVQKNLFK